ncbi:YraN family protein [Chlorobaculum sp. 24CR]|uniref:YraN family protein n=1 Tax=Chlorobaculum sp. 24CR TaxID=2508878 RepID=UPI00100A4F84|nr:YraN family protein [Chlorobaculum sp. 24CR]RXK87797.1 YraN family protein [Chlorobaculum sp. 24CR]
MHTPQWLGIEGEKIAARHLVAKGYRIVERNYRYHRNEIDIIAFDREALCFIEVKTRASVARGHPAESVTLRKQKEIARAAVGYLAALDDPWITCRFDVIAVLARSLDERSIREYEIEHIKAAFMIGDRR